jgi:hypothetical protein
VVSGGVGLLWSGVAEALIANRCLYTAESEEPVPSGVEGIPAMLPGFSEIEAIGIISTHGPYDQLCRPRLLLSIFIIGERNETSSVTVQGPWTMTGT